MLLREAAMEDVPRLVPLMATLGYPTDEPTLRAGLAAILVDPSYRTVVAEVDGVLAGLVGMLEEAALSGIDLIATWAYPRDAEAAAQAYFEAVGSRGGQIHLVRLVCDREVLLARVGDDSRRAMDKLTDPSKLELLLDDRFEPRW